MSYEEKLNQAKNSYPFARWQKSEIEYYTEENCGAMRKIFDDLIADLNAKGENASDAEKIESFLLLVL